MGSTGEISHNTTLLLFWLLHTSLRERAVCDELSQPFAEQLLRVGDPVDPLRGQASALPKMSREGLPVQPLLWAFALAVMDTAHRKRRGLGRCAVAAFFFSTSDQFRQP